MKKLQSIESRQNDEAIALQQEQGFTAESHPDDATFLLVESNARNIATRQKGTATHLNVRACGLLTKINALGQLVARLP